MALTTSQSTLMGGLTTEKAKLADQSNPIAPSYGDTNQMLEACMASLNLIRSGSEEVAGSADTVAITFGTTTAEKTAFEGKPAIATMGEADGGDRFVEKCTWSSNGSGVLTITLSGNTDDARTVFYMVDGR